MKLIMTKGLPGSGKSTKANELVLASGGNTKRVNKDELRTMFDAGKWTKSNEKNILTMRDILVNNLLGQKVSVIVDDTNLALQHEVALRQIAKNRGAQFEILDFTDVPLEECIKRDLARPRSVGEKVIRDMWKQFLKPAPPAPPSHDPLLEECVICDIDGTVALMDGRSPYDYSKVDTDKPNVRVLELVMLLAQFSNVIFVSGRKSVCREATEKWLWDNTPGLPDLALYMRADGDDRDDRIVKREIYEREIKGKYNVKFVLDDRNRVVDMWRNDLGLTCLQVAEGDF